MKNKTDKYPSMLFVPRETISKLKRQVSAMKQAINDIYGVVVDNGDETSEEIRKITEDVMDNHW